MKQKVKYIFRQVVNLFKFMKYFKVNRNSLNAIAAELMRNTHSIEKGLSIDNVRLGFGHAKQKIMMDYVDILSKHDSIYYDEVIKMAVSSLEAYVNYHVKRNYNDDFIPIIKDFLLKYNFYIKDSYGGTVKINYKKLKFDIKLIENFINSRHSIRNFSNKPVDEKK